MVAVKVNFGMSVYAIKNKIGCAMLQLLGRDFKKASIRKSFLFYPLQIHFLAIVKGVLDQSCSQQICVHCTWDFCWN